jgi:hypothetical protein
VKIETIRAGQARAYQDSVYHYRITEAGEATEHDVVEFASQKNRRSFLPEHQRREELRDVQFEGSSGFSNGLDTFWSLRKNTEGTWLLRIVEPYCD